MLIKLCLPTESDMNATDVNTIEELRIRVISAFDKVKRLAANSDLMTKIKNNIVRRYNLCIQQNGAHIENFKI